MWTLFATGAVLLLVGLLVGLVPAHIPAMTSPSCGSPWSPNYDAIGLAQLGHNIAAAEYGNAGDVQDYAQQCQQAFGSRSTIAAVLAALGGATILGCGFLAAARQRPTPTH